MVFELKRMDGQKVLITGGLGFMGSNLAVRCVELGAEVTILDKSFERIENIRDIEHKVKLLKGEITRYEDVEMAVRGKDIIFHLAAQISHFVSMENPSMDVDVNLIGTMNVLEACRNVNKNVKLVSVGTVTQSGVAKMLPIDESFTDWPIEIYSLHKLVCEKYFKIYNKVHGLNTTFFRLGTLYGDRQKIDDHKRGITNFFIGRIFRGEPITIYGDGLWKRDYNYIGNVIDALILATQNENARGESFLLGGEIMYFVDMVKEVVNAVERVTGKRGEITFVEFPEGEKSVDVGDTEIDYNKVTKMIGWEPRLGFKEGIEKTVRYYHER